jgi:ferredoxin-NADP reductase
MTMPAASPHQRVLAARVQQIRHEAEGVVSVELRPATAEVVFPPFEPGAHIDLHLPNGLVRSYSLCNPAEERERYVVGVAKDRNSRGGSRYVHEQLHQGQRIDICVPRNNFALHEYASRSVLVCGGIGVTPIFCMLQRLVALGREVDVVYCARSRQEAAFAAAIGKLGDKARITWHFDDEQGAAPDLTALLAGLGAQSHYYCCGPSPMLDAFEKTCRQLAYPHSHIERFAGVASTSTLEASSFAVRCEKSGKSVEVQVGKSIMDALIEAGLNPDHSCREGVCGACETTVLDCDGEIDHRDSILTESERQSGRTMMICVSRCVGKHLVLDI